MSGARLDYDLMAQEYAAHRKVHPGVLESLIEMGRITEHSVVLEIGIGSGNYASAIRAATGCTMLGLDPSQEMLARASAQDAALRVTEGVAEALPYP
ncbi:MAG: class I SAM-dependent methyltransferase, partial [Chloroflexota bacterium]